jgi:hypothetical protein
MARHRRYFAAKSLTNVASQNISATAETVLPRCRVMVAEGNSGKPSSLPSGRTPLGSTLRLSTVTARPAVTAARMPLILGAGIGDPIRLADLIQAGHGPFPKRANRAENSANGSGSAS